LHILVTIDKEKRQQSTVHVSSTTLLLTKLPQYCIE